MKKSIKSLRLIPIIYSLFICTFCVLAIVNIGCFSAKKNIATKNDFKGEKYRVAFYNVENLFDIVDDPKKKDEDYSPDGKYEWTNEKYQKKLGQLSRVVNALKTEDWPEIVGLCEIENKAVVEDLLTNAQLSNYGIVHKESDDERGIDVAMIYDKSEVKILEQDFLKVTLPSGDNTRDVLYVKVEMAGENVHLFFNHWPSRYSDKTGGLRKIAAGVVKNKVDKVFKTNPNAKIVIMGDFNDSPTDASIESTLGAMTVSSQTKEESLYNLSREWSKQKTGTHYYYNYKEKKGSWNILDQIIVSNGVLNQETGLNTETANAHILAEDWMNFYDRNTKVNRPSRFMNARTGKIYGGFSDHYPVYLDFVVE